MAVFGPYLWTSFHIMAVNYPNDPTDITKNAAINFIKSIPWMIPCGNCGYHFKKFIIEEYLPNLKNDIGRKYQEITKNKQNMIIFFVEAHNNVTKNTNKVGKLWRIEEAKEFYKKRLQMYTSKLSYLGKCIIKT